MDLYNFLPKYPNIINKELDPYDGETLNDVIYNKKEFREIKLSEYENIKKGQLMKHQKIISRYLSSYTPYDGILLFHYMGTGKTCSSIGTVEKIMNEKNSPYKKVLILCKGKSIINNWITEIVEKCTDNKYIPDDFDQIKKWNKKILILKKILKKNYEFHTFHSFVKKIQNYNSSILNQMYNNSIIIIDEIHNIKRDNDKYKPIHNFLHSIYNKKVILLSGTPMKDQPEEISSVLNLILPKDKQLPVGKAFINMYLNNNDNIQSIKPEKKKELRQYFTGRISYLKFFVNNVNKKYIGESIGKLKYMKVFVDYMGENQSEIYLKKFEEESRGKGVDDDKEIVKMNWFSGSRQSSLFVFPDKSFGSKGFNKYIKTIKHQSYDLNGKKKVYYTYLFDRSFLNLFSKVKKDDFEGRLEIVKQFSSKYYTIIKSILENKDKKALIFSEFVKGSGLIVLSKLLELFDFTQANGRERSDSPRYMILTHKTITQSQLKRLIYRFNQPDNIYGEKIRIVLGSRIISEGLSLFNIQNVHIMTGHWNYSLTEQTIYRAIRADSHFDLLKQIDNVDVNVFLHVSVPINQKKEVLDNKSIDLRLYEISEKKDISIKNIEHFIKLNAFDCKLNYKRNSQYKDDDSRDCEYTKCDYECESNDIIDGIDDSTYKLYYNYDNIENIKTKVIKLFQNIVSIEFNLLLAYINKDTETNYNQIDLLYTLKLIIDNNIPIYNKYGIVSYLKEYNNTFFIVNDLHQKVNNLFLHYTNNPIRKIDRNFLSMINELYIEYFNNDLLDKLLKLENIDILLENIPYNVQEIILESCILANKLNLTKNKNFVEKVLNKYGNNIVTIKDTIFSTFLYERNGDIRCLNNRNTWNDCDEDVLSTFFEFIETQKNEFKEKPLSGKYDIDDKFLIVDKRDRDAVESDDKRDNPKGRACMNYNRDYLRVILYSLGIKIDIELLSKSKKKDYNNNNENKTNMLSKIKKSLPDSISKSLGITQSDLQKDLGIMKQLFYYSLLTKKNMCKLIEKHFKENDLIDNYVDQK